MGTLIFDRHSIRTKILYRFMIVILVTIIIFEAIITFGVNSYYYSNIEHVLVDKTKTLLDIYDTYLGYESLNYKAKFILENETVPQYVEAQIVDVKGEVIETTSHYKHNQRIDTADFNGAIAGNIQIWRGRDSLTNEYVLAVSAPLYQAGSINGVLRVITSVEDVRTTIQRFIITAYLIGLLVLVVVLYFSLLMANRIIAPIYELKTVADNIAIGNMSARAHGYEQDEIGELAETINYMANEIDKNENLKNEFISSISHELRTPLTSIKGWSETILTGDIENVHETTLGLEMIARESERLSGLVENLLDFSKLEAQHITLNPQYVDLYELIERVFNQFYVTFKEKGLHSEVIAETRKIAFYGDRDRMKQVLINLIDNSVKHSARGGWIRCRLALDQDIIIKIEDEGEGISAEHLAHITERFYKASSTKSGSGLGLAIVRHIVALHGGQLDIDSTLGKGTTVTLRLPRNLERGE